MMPPFALAAGTARVSAVSRFSHPLNESWLIRVRSHLPCMSHSSSHSVPLSLCNINLPAALRSAWCTVLFSGSQVDSLLLLRPLVTFKQHYWKSARQRCVHLALLCNPGFPFEGPLNFSRGELSSSFRGLPFPLLCDVARAAGVPGRETSDFARRVRFTLARAPPWGAVALGSLVLGSPFGFPRISFLTRPDDAYLL